MVEPRVTAEFHEPLLSRVVPPRWRERWLRRDRVDRLLAIAAEVRLTVLAAPAGFGKTVALAGLAARGGWPVAWCRVAHEPAESLLAHLAAACAALAPPAAAANSPDTLANALARGLDDETLLILDNADALTEEAARLVGTVIDRLPEQVHVILAARRAPLAPFASALLARGDAARIGPEDLAFTLAEATELFARYTRGEVEPAYQRSAGWPIALDVAARLGSGAEADAALAAFVEREVLAPLAERHRRLLLALATAEEPAAISAVAAVFEAPLDEPTIQGLGIPVEGGLLVPAAREALRRIGEVDTAWWEAMNRKIAARLDGAPAALRHLLLAGDETAARAQFEQNADRWLVTDPLAVAEWFDQLYRDPVPAAPTLAAARAKRATGRVREAIALAERAQQAAASDPRLLADALQLLGTLFLDTVEPRRARPPLKRAARLLAWDADRCAANLRLQAESWIDSGRPALARRLLDAARDLVGGRAEPDPPRLLLRTGRLAAAREALETAIGVGSAAGVAAAHRTPALLLAYLDAVLGRGARALAMARRGILEAQETGHTMTEAVAWTRLGHAQQVAAPLDPQTAVQSYETAIAAARAAGTERTEAEAHLGLLLARGHAGESRGAEEAFDRASSLAQRAGDHWLAAWATLARATVGVANDEEQAGQWLELAEARLRRVADDFGVAVTALWRALLALRQGTDAGAAVETLLDLVARHGLAGLLSGPSLYGPRDAVALVPVLLRGRRTRFAETAEAILRSAFPTVAADDAVTDYHPGYTLRIQLLGSFRVWRGGREIAAREWQREKAKQLFQLLVTFRGRWLQREQICALLWPDVDSNAAELQFKVALNALNAAIEPRRPPRVAPFFVRRNGLAYAFAPRSGVWIDVDEFDLRVESAARGDDAFAVRSLASAVALYRGDYLAEALYDPWTLEERERLVTRYLAAAVDLGHRLLAHGEVGEAVRLGEAVLRRDRAYERAHHLLLRAHAAAGDREAAMRVFRRCRRALAEELGAEPLPETIALAERIRQGMPLSPEDRG